MPQLIHEYSRSYAPATIVGQDCDIDDVQDSGFGLFAGHVTDSIAVHDDDFRYEIWMIPLTVRHESPAL